MNPMFRRMAVVRACLVMFSGAILFGSAPCAARAGLDEYVKKPDPAFAWSVDGQPTTPAGSITSIKLTSQVWQGMTWSHDLRIYEPREILHPDAMLLFITGGDNDRKASDDDHKQAFVLAQLCGAGRGAAAGAQPTAPGRQDRGRADRRDVRPLPRRPRMKTGRCSSPWSRVQSGRWMPCKRWPRRMASRR